jgi:hypothetical protein
MSMGEEVAGRSQSLSRRASVPSPIFTKHEAATFCRVSIRTFEREVQPELPTVRIGARVLFHEEDLLKWLDRKKDGVFTSTVVARPTSSVSRTKVDATPSPRANEILARLRQRQRAPTPRLFQVDERSVGKRR